MQVYGERFLLINGWMNFLSLCLASCMRRGRLRMGRAAMASALGAVYAVLAWIGPQWGRGIPALLGAALLMAMVADGPRCMWTTPLLFAAGWLLGGCANFMMGRGFSAGGTIMLCGGAVLTVCLLIRGPGLPRQGQYLLTLTYRGKTACLHAIPDSGNLLVDSLTGLPVIVVPASGVQAVIPPGTRTDDLATLPRGFHLLRAQTAAGCRTLMCFCPDGITVARGKRHWRVEAAVALSDYGDDRALLPEMMFAGMGEGYHASL